MVKLNITWNHYYSNEIQFWVSIVSLQLTVIMISYLFITSSRKIWRQDKSKMNSLSGSIKGLVTMYLVLVWIENLLFLATRVFLLMLGGNTYCWLPDYPVLLHMLARLILAWMYLTRFDNLHI